MKTKNPKLDAALTVFYALIAAAIYFFITNHIQ